MPILLDKNTFSFPSIAEADENGIVAIGGDFNPQRLVAAYHAGIFPWPHEDLPLLWFCPDPRFYLAPKDVRINKTLAKSIKKTSLKIICDHDFLAVMKECQKAKRKEQDGTWITNEMIEGYHELHQLGYAHSVEAYDGDALVGGLYGVSLGGAFFGESMFSKKTDASKICFIVLAAHLLAWQFILLDCQAHTGHLEKLGAKLKPRSLFLRELKKSYDIPDKLGPWRFFMSPTESLEKFVA